MSCNQSCPEHCPKPVISGFAKPAPAPVTHPLAAPAPKLVVPAHVDPYGFHKRQQDALAWYRKESAHPTRNRYEECLRTVRIALGCPGGTDWAVHVWTNAAKADKHTDLPPRGYPVVQKGGGKYGHIVTVEKTGRTWRETQVWSTDIKRHGCVDLTTIAHLEDHWGMKTLGWVSVLNGVDLTK